MKNTNTTYRFTLPERPGESIFKVPERYFTALPQAIEAKLAFKTAGFSLDALPRQNVFASPNDYFTSLSQTLQQRLQPLESMPRQNIFQVPTGYFERLPQLIMQQVHGLKQQAGWVLNLQNFAATYKLALAPAMAVLIIASVAGLKYGSNKNSTTMQTVELAGVTNAQIIEYLQQNENVSTLEVIDAAELTKNTTALNILDEGLEGISKGDISTYELDDAALDELILESGTI